MESDNIVEHTIDLDTSGLGHLTFPLDNDGSVTTDGTLLSSLTTDTINDDMSSTSVLRVLPHVVDNHYSRSLTPNNQTHFGGQIITVPENGSIQPATTYELTELGVDSGIDVSSKLVSDSNNILLASNLPIQPTITLATWPQDMLTSVEPNGEFTTDSGLIGMNKLPDFKTFSQGPGTVPTIGTSYLSTAKTFVQTSGINIHDKQILNGSFNTQNQIYHQLMPRNNGVNIRPLQVENVQQQTISLTPNNIQNVSNTGGFTLRFPLPTTLGKGMQLHLVAKGQGELPVTETTTNPTYQQVNHGNNIQGQVTQHSNTGSGVMLFRDKATGKNYIIPTGPASVIVNSSTQVPDSQHQGSSAINSDNVAVCDSPPIDVIGNGNDPYGDLGIAEAQPVIDVNEFLNIPPKVIHTEKIVTNDVQSNDNVGSILPPICEPINSILNDNSNTNTTDKYINKETVKSDGNTNEIIVVPPNFNMQSKQSLVMGSEEQVAGKKSSSSDTTSTVTKQLVLTDSDISKATTGEDLIKMMAVKKSSRKVQKDTKQSNMNIKKEGTDENQPNKSTVKGKSNMNLSSHNDESGSALETDDEHSKDISFDESELDISIHSEEGQMDSSIMETEQRIASIVPDSMKDFVRDIFEDEDALDKEYIQEIMDDTGPAERHVDRDSALSPGDIAKHAVQKLVDTVDDLKDMGVKSNNSNMIPSVSVQVDKSQIVVVDGVRKWKCNICPKMYSTKHTLVTHILGHCEIKPHCCVVCGKQFKQPSHLHTHMLTHRQIKAHVCKVCGRGFTQPSHLKRHSAVHMDKKPHVCDICKRGFTYPSELRAHKEKHTTGQELECEKCGEVFNSTKLLKQHSASHKDISELTCKDCGKVFAFPSQLRDHMMKHNGLRPFICAECGMDFMKEHHLKAHQFTHTGEQPFVCKVCDRSFNQKANLRRHVLIHEENKRYKCHKCDREFSQPQVLKSHIATHEGTKPFKCEECGKRFSRQHNLNGHMAMHQGNKKYVCFCGASFTLKGNLNRHKKGKHDVDVAEEPAVEQMAAETAAKILNMMSAKKVVTNETDTDTKDQNENIENTIPVTSSYRFIQKFSASEEVSQKNNFDLSLSVPVLEEQETDVSNQYEEDSPLPKKKRKSVPSKIISKEGKIIESSSGDNASDNTIQSKELQGENSQKMGIITPVKRKQLKPKCLPFPAKSNEKNDSNVQVIPSSTRRKQKAVVKATVSPEDIQDEAEQEWQGTNLEDSRSGMENSNENNKECCEISGRILVDLQRENDNSITTLSTDDSNSNIDARTSFSNLLNDVIGTSDSETIKSITIANT